MSEGVTYDRSRGEHVVQIILDSTEARNIAHALGLRDKGAQDLLAWADEADEKNGIDLDLRDTRECDQ